MSAEVVDLAGERQCVCGHARREHEFCSDDYPAMCVHPEPGEGLMDWPVCHCLEFETDDEAIA